MNMILDVVFNFLGKIGFSNNNVKNFRVQKITDIVVYFFRLMSFDRNFISPSIYMRNNVFVLKIHLLLLFFFPVFLVMFMFFDSYLTIDYIFFFYTDEADFDDFIAVIYMILFFFLILADYDSHGGQDKNNVVDLVELASNQGSDINLSYAYYNSEFDSRSSFNTVYYDKNFFSKALVLSSSSLQVINKFTLLNLSQLKSNNSLISKLPIDRYILDDVFVLDLNFDDKFSFLSGVTVDDMQLEDSNDLFLYSFYLILFDLELSRLFLFINNVLLNWMNSSLTYLKFFVKNSIFLLTGNFDFSSQLRFLLSSKNAGNVLFPSLHKVYLTNFLSNVVESNDDLVVNDYIEWFLNRNN